MLQSCLTLCDPIAGSPPSLGFFRQEHWSGLPLPFPMHESEVAQLCPTLIDPVDCSLPGSSAHGIFQARVLEWGAIAFSGKADSLPDKMWNKAKMPQSHHCYSIVQYWKFQSNQARKRKTKYPIWKGRHKTHYMLTVKAMVFPVVRYRCEGWTIKKAEQQKTMLSNCDVGEDS